MLYLGFLATFSALANVATLIPASSALPASENALVPRGPDALNILDHRQATGLSNEFLDHYIEFNSTNANFLINTTFPHFFGSKDDSGGNCCDGKPACHGFGGFKAGKPWMACWNPGSEQIIDADVEAMKCIINLHYLQPDKCIDIRGSVCSNGYGGGLMRGQNYYANSAHDKKSQLTAEESSTLQGAAASLSGVKINYASGPHGSEASTEAIILWAVNARGDGLNVEIDFNGHQGADC